MKNIAVLIDLENISPQIIDEAMGILSTLGKIIVKKAYGDFSKPSNHLPTWKKPSLKYNIEMIHHFSCKANKNSSDILLAIDAVEILYQHQIDIFCIISSDSDFSSLIQCLKRHQCQVIGMGSIPPNDSYTLLFEKFYHLQNKSEIVASQTIKLEYSEQVTPSKKLNLLSRIAIPLYKFLNKKKQAPQQNLEQNIPTKTVQDETSSKDEAYEQKMIQRIYKLSKKSNNGYVLQSLFASNMTPEERAYIQEKYKTFGQFVVKSRYLTIAPQQNDNNQYWLKPKSISK